MRLQSFEGAKIRKHATAIHTSYLFVENLLFSIFFVSLQKIWEYPNLGRIINTVEA